MKVAVACHALLDGLSCAAGAAPSRTPKAALQGVLITALEDSILLMTTDLEVGIRYQVSQVQVEKQGQALVPVNKLLQIVRECSDDTIGLELAENALNIRGSDSHFRVFAGDPHEFPPVADLEGNADFELSAEQLRLIIDRTLFAAARESTRYAIDGLLWDLHDGGLKVVATDGRRLAVVNCPVEGGKKTRAIVPAKAVALLGRIVSDNDEMFKVKCLPNQILVKSERVTVASVLVEGHFPKYEDVIPQENDKKVRFNVSEMLSAVRRASLLTSEDAKAIRLRLADNQAVMTGRAPEQGEASIQVPLSYTAEPMEIGFNPNFLIDVLKIIGLEEVDFELKDANRPGLFRTEDYLYVVMPVNLT